MCKMRIHVDYLTILDIIHKRATLYVFKSPNFHLYLAMY